MTAGTYFLVEECGECFVITLQSNLGSLEVERVRDELAVVHDVLRQSRKYHVVIDLSQMAYFGSTVLEWMLAVWKQVKEHDGRMALCNVSDTGLEILHSARFETLWPIYPTRADAVEQTA